MRIRPLIAGLATLAVGATMVATTAPSTAATMASASAADDLARNHQVALVDGTDEQLEFKSSTSGSGQTATYDGRTIVFATDAPLVPEDDNAEPDVYLRDLDQGVTVLVSEVDGVPGNDISHEPTISADGRYVAFTTWADNLTAEDTNGHVLDVVVKDLQEDEIVLASVSTAELQRDRNSFSPVISDDGRSVAFQSFGSFDRRDDDNREDVYVRDLDAGLTRQGSLLPGTNRDVRMSVLVGDLTGDGSVVTFGNSNNLWARNVETGTTIRFWHEPDAPPCQPFPMGSAGRPAISADGRFAAFSSCATDLPGENGEFADVYRINLTTGRIVRVHAKADGHSYLPSLSADGRYVGFGSEASSFVAGDTHAEDAFVVDTRTGTLTLASQGYDDTAGNNRSAPNDIAISGDGQTLVYVSYADNLVEGDLFDLREVFVWQAHAAS